MADPITWYLLPKKVDDNTTIEEEIDNRILLHNLDPSAHGQSDEAIFNHRMSEILDHINYSIYNIKLNPISRPIKAFVDSGGASEFTDLQAAITYVATLGGGKIFVYSGQYNLSDDINIPANVKIEGEDRDSVILNFNYATKGIVISSPTYGGAHNIELKNLTIYQSGNSTNGAIRVYHGNGVRIENVGLNSCYHPVSYSPARIEIIESIDTIVNNCYFVDSGGIRVDEDSSNTRIKNNLIQSPMGIVININSSTFTYITDNIIIGSAGSQIYVNGSDVIISRNFLIGVNYYGIEVDTYATNVKIVDNEIYGEEYGEVGIYIENTSGNNIVSNNLITNYFTQGIYITSADYNIITNNRIRNVNTGIYIANSVDRTIVSLNNLYNCTTAITDNGTNTSKVGNIIS